MKAVIFYLLQVIACSGVLYGYYHFFLRNKKFHRYNRYYLLIAATISVLVPFVKIPIYFTSEQDIPAIYKILAEVQVSNGLAAQRSVVIDWESLSFALYCIVTFILISRIILSINKLRKNFKHYPHTKAHDLVFINTTEKGTPYSFMNWLFWDSSIPVDSVKGQRLFQHEAFHIRQRHTLDVLFMEFLSAFFWTNPFFLQMKKEIKAIHEFSADEFAMDKENQYEYAELLLQRALQTDQKLVTPFFHNQIKRRIAMITKSSTTKHQYLRKTMVLPVALLTISIVAANCKSKEAYSDINQSKKDQALSRIEVLEPTKTIKSSEPDDKIYEKVEVEPAFQNGETGWQQFLQKNINANVPVDNGAPAGQYTCWVQFIVDKDGRISDIKTLTNHGFGIEQEVVRIMNLSPNWIAGSNNGTAVKAYRKQPITFVISEE